MKSPKQLYEFEVQSGLRYKYNVNKYFYDAYLSKVYGDLTKTSELQRGQIYTFRYDPLYKDVLDYYDENPLTLIYDYYQAQTGNYLYRGINLHFLPPEIKLEVLEVYWKYYYRMGGQKIMKILPIKYTDFFQFVFKFLRNINYQFAIRTYILQRVSSPMLVKQEDWGKIPLWIPSFIEGQNISEIYKTYKKIK